MTRTLVVAPESVELTSLEVRNLIVAAENINTAVALDRAVFERRGEVYRYQLFTTDGRTWAQTIQFDITASNPLMTFDVKDFWRLSEFVAQRDFRDALVGLVGVYPALESVTYRFRTEKSEKSK